MPLNDDTQVVGAGAELVASGERATTLVRCYKQDLDRNRSVLRELEQELASRTVPAHRGANPRPPDLVPLSRDLNAGGDSQLGRRSSYRGGLEQASRLAEALQEDGLLPARSDGRE